MGRGARRCVQVDRHTDPRPRAVDVTRATVGNAGAKTSSLYYLASGPVPSEAANAVNVTRMSAALEATGYEVSILAPTTNLVEALRRRRDLATAEASGRHLMLERAWFPRTRGGGAVYRSMLSGMLKRRRPDFVYGRMLHGCRIAARLGIPTAFEAHMPVWEHDPVKEAAFREMTRAPAYCGTVVISNALGNALVAAYPDVTDRVIVAHDAAESRPCPPFRAADARERFDVLYAGSLYPGKGIEMLVQLAARCPWAHFTVLGGSEGDVDRWRSAPGGNLGNVEFLGRRPHSAVADCLETAHVLVAPYQTTVSARGERRDISRWMSPLKLFEYMAANRPIVASDLPVLREILEHDRNALLAAPTDVDQWAKALDTLRGDPELARRLAAAARAEFEREHTWTVRARRVVDALGWPSSADSAGTAASSR